MEDKFYTHKELESLGHAKNIPPQDVKMAIQSLVGSGDVLSDVAGSEILFWAPPDYKLSACIAKAEKLIQEIHSLQTEYDHVQQELQSVGPESGVRHEDLAQLKAQLIGECQRCDDLRKQVDAFERCGPEGIAEMQRLTRMAKQAANRWADNIEGVRSNFLKDRDESESSRQFNDSFGLPMEFDYLT